VHRRLRLHFAFRREDVRRPVHSIGVLHELMRIADLLLQLEQAAQPVEGLLVARTDPSLALLRCAAMPSSATRCISSVGSQSRTASQFADHGRVQGPYAFGAAWR
jgi:hypothetical protein